MIEIPWERTADGRSANIKEDFPQYIIPVLSFLRLSEEKMTGVGLISGHFHNIPVSFLLRIGVFLESHTYDEFLGLYLPDEEDVVENVPTLCLRRASWQRKNDNTRFIQAASMKAYVMNEQQLDSHIVFLRSEQAQGIVRLAEEARTLVQQGLPMQRTTRTKYTWDQIYFQYRNIIHMSLSYVTQSEKNEALESWIAQWQEQFAEVDMTSGHLPDQGCFIGYSFGMREYLTHFPEQSFQEWKKRKR